MLEVPQFILGRALAKDPIFSAEEVATWPEGLLNQLVADGILEAAENAASVACCACGDDHVEEVQYVESPPGTELRGCIPCPENGRVLVPLGRLRRWIVIREKLPVSENQPLAADTIGKGSRKKHGAHDAVRKRSWTQPDLDNAIREYKAKRGSTYNDLVEGVKSGRSGAKKSAQKMFGRNAIARSLGVRSKAMVSKSPAWQEIAEELKLPRGSSKGPSKEQRIGLEIAVEERSVATSEAAVDQVIRRETIHLIEKSMPKVEAEATVEKLRRGEITDDQAREMVHLYTEQKQDKAARNTRQTL